MKYYWFLLAMLGAWRLTHLLVAEDGPWKAVAKLRRTTSGLVGGLFDCFYCLSLWIAVPFAILVGESNLERLLLWLALSGGAILLERATGGVPAIYREDREDDDAMLR